MVDRLTFLPNPDYFAALLWRRTVGTTVLPMPQLTAERGDSVAAGVAEQFVRVYAACLLNDSALSSGSGGDVVLITLNFGPAATVNISVPAALVPEQQTAQRLTWMVRSASPAGGSGAPASNSTGILSKDISLLQAGGFWSAPLALVRHGGSSSSPSRFDGWALPEMPPVTEASDAPISLPPQSYAFSVLQIGAKACLPRRQQLKTEDGESSAPPRMIDRQALVKKHNPKIKCKTFKECSLLDFQTLGNGDFAFSVDATGLQTFNR
eukprot:SAG22_NODE_477_length_9978_cov_2.807268_5_plen_266_part_00